jgi:hypothetical protein
MGRVGKVEMKEWGRGQNESNESSLALPLSPDNPGNPDNPVFLLTILSSSWQSRVPPMAKSVSSVSNGGVRCMEGGQGMEGVGQSEQSTEG